MSAAGVPIIRPGQDALAGQRSTGWIRAAAFMAVLVICAGSRLWLMSGVQAISRDGPVFIAMARAWSAGPAQVARHYDFHVGYPAAMSWLHRAIWAASDDNAGWERSGQIISLVSSVAAMAALWFLAEMTFGWHVALVATLALSLTRHWAILGTDVMSDALAISLQMWAVVLALWTLRRLGEGHRRALLLAAATGLCAGAGYLVRPEALLTIVMAAALWLGFQLHQRRHQRLAIGAIVVALLTTSVCVAPYACTIGALTKKKSVQDMIHVSQGRGLPLAFMDRATGTSALTAVAAQTVEAMHPALFILAAMWVVCYLGCLALPHGFAVWTVPRARPAGAWMMIGAVALMAPVLMRLYQYAGYLDYRHAMFLGVMLAPLAGAGAVMVHFLVQLFCARWPPLGAAIKVLAWTALFVGLLAHTVVHPPHEGAWYVRQAALRLAPALRSDDAVLCDNNLFLYYGRVQGQSVHPEKYSANGLRALIVDSKPAVSYIAFTGLGLADNRPFWALLKGPMFHELPAVGQEGAKPADAVHVFRVDRAALGTGGAPGRP